MFVWYLLNTPVAARACRLLPSIMPLIRAIPHGGRKRTGGPPADPSVRQKLAELDTRLTAMQEKPRSKDYLPPDTPPAIALAADRGADDSGWGLGFILLLVLVGVVVWFAWRRLSAGRRAREAGGASRGSLLVRPIGRIGSALA